VNIQKQTYSFYSIIVPSFNRLDEINELLPAIENLKFDRKRFELIIVDDGSTDDTVSLLEGYKQKTDINFSFYTQKNQGPGAARNTGMSNAKGDFFIFIDSDCSVPPQWLSEIDKNFIITAGDAFGGPDSFRADFPPLLKAINYSMTSFITTGGLRGKKGKKLAKFYPRSFNMGLSRKIWENRVEFIETAHVYHKRRTNFKRFYKQVYNWGVARINLYKIDKSMLEPLHAIPAIFTFSVFTICVLALFFDFFRLLFVAGCLLWCLIVLYSMIDALRMYKEIKPALLVPFIIPAQIFGYGLGFINNFIRRIILGKPEKVGFKKTYYK